MFYLFLVVGVVLIVIVGLKLLSLILSAPQNYNNKMSAVECGFSGFGKTNNTYSLQFFMLMIVFILFDLEVVFFLGLLVKDLWCGLSVLLVYWFVVMSLYCEWGMQKLVWPV